MSRPIVLHICLAFSSLLFLSFATQCLAFPKLERRETAHAYAEGLYERMDTDDQESSSIALKHTPQQMFSEDTTILSTGSTVTPLDKAFSTNEETHLPGARLLQPNSPESPPLHTAIEPTSEEVHGSSESERMSSEHRHSKDLLTIPVIAIASLSPDEKGPFSSSSTQPLAEGMTAATQGFLNYVDNQLFATESQKRVSLGHSPSSYINTKEMLTTNPGTEEVHLDASQRTTSFPGVDSIASTEPDGVQPSQMTADNDQTTMTKHLMATSEYALSVEPETDSRLEAPEATLSVSTAVPAASVMSDEWDDTKLESISQKRPPESGDNPETPVRIEPPKTTHLSLEGAEGDLPSTVVAEVAPELNEGETPMGTALLITQGGERSLILTHQSSFTTTSLMDDTGVSIVNLFQSTGGSTEEDGATFFSETTASVSEYESEVYQSLGVTLKEIITQEMTTATPELEATLPVLTQEQVATIEVTRDGVEVEEDLVDTVTGPNEEFTPVLGAPETISGTTVEVPTIFPVLPSEGRTVSSISHNTAASYDLDQLESKEGEDEDEEDEEDEDEEEEDEEEDEEDKDTDALDESFDGDTELPGFTVPGVTSQEPGIESGNMDLLEGATYQVPDAIEWEQQNQGLVRSWMEKLKDKAGYMSGMLVPVGVGIAGALFILAALYSIKVMNRRRRNGFKRHKRKQREFNSMQDRVMLLADSSEDEF